MKGSVFVTGASRGIGLGISKYFFERGHKVFGLDIEKVSNSEYFEDFFICDVSSAKGLKKVLEEMKTKNIKIDALINNASIQVEKTLIDTSEEEWDRVIDVNLKSVFLTTKIFRNMFAASSSIINISSVHSRATSSGLAAYVASKGGVTSLSRAMALELAKFGIRVNSVHPGAIDSLMLEKGLERTGDKEAARTKMINSSPLGKIGSSEHVASLVYFLCDTKAASNITGQEFFCDGGVAAKLASE